MNRTVLAETDSEEEMSDYGPPLDAGSVNLASKEPPCFTGELDMATLDNLPVLSPYPAVNRSRAPQSVATCASRTDGSRVSIALSRPRVSNPKATLRQLETQPKAPMERAASEEGEAVEVPPGQSCALPLAPKKKLLRQWRGECQRSISSAPSPACRSIQSGNNDPPLYSRIASLHSQSAVLHPSAVQVAPPLARTSNEPTSLRAHGTSHADAGAASRAVAAVTAKAQAPSQSTKPASVALSNADHLYTVLPPAIRLLNTPCTGGREKGSGAPTVQPPQVASLAPSPDCRKYTCATVNGQTPPMVSGDMSSEGIRMKWTMPVIRTDHMTCKAEAVNQTSLHMRPSSTFKNFSDKEGHPISRSQRDIPFNPSYATWKPLSLPPLHGMPPLQGISPCRTAPWDTERSLPITVKALPRMAAPRMPSAQLGRPPMPIPSPLTLPFTAPIPSRPYTITQASSQNRRNGPMSVERSVNPPNRFSPNVSPPALAGSFAGTEPPVSSSNGRASSPQESEAGRENSNSRRRYPVFLETGDVRYDGACTPPLAPQPKILDFASRSAGKASAPTLPTLQVPSFAKTALGRTGRRDGGALNASVNMLGQLQTRHAIPMPTSSEASGTHVIQGQLWTQAGTESGKLYRPVPLDSVISPVPKTADTKSRSGLATPLERGSSAVYVKNVWPASQLQQARYRQDETRRQVRGSGRKVVDSELGCGGDICAEARVAHGTGSSRVNDCTPENPVPLVQTFRGDNRRTDTTEPIAIYDSDDFSTLEDLAVNERCPTDAGALQSNESIGREFAQAKHSGESETLILAGNRSGNRDFWRNSLQMPRSAEVTKTRAVERNADDNRRKSRKRLRSPVQEDLAKIPGASGASRNPSNVGVGKSPSTSETVNVDDASTSVPVVVRKNPEGAYRGKTEHMFWRRATKLPSVDTQRRVSSKLVDARGIQIPDHATSVNRLGPSQQRFSRSVTNDIGIPRSLGRTSERDESVQDVICRTATAAASPNGFMFGDVTAGNHARQLVEIEMQKIETSAMNKVDVKMNLRGRNKLENWLLKSDIVHRWAVAFVAERVDLDPRVTAADTRERKIGLCNMVNEHLRIMDALMTRLSTREGTLNWHAIAEKGLNGSLRIGSAFPF